jgi:hypothetical protein
MPHDYNEKKATRIHQAHTQIIIHDIINYAFTKY